MLLGVIREVDLQERTAREKLGQIASFVIESYRHDPDLMKVIIVEVTRAANSFGRIHLAQIREAFSLIAVIVTKAQAEGDFRPEFAAGVRRHGLLRGDRAGSTGWIFGLLPAAVSTSSRPSRCWSRRSAAAWMRPPLAIHSRDDR